uniref:Uncharacterized protein n=1 Tax=Oryza nivara TaxID=4536 RepID=A0A0E0FWU0_ORYNI
MDLDPNNITGRPYFVDVLQSIGHPIPATAVPDITLPVPPGERRTTRPESETVYLNFTPSPEMLYFSRRFAYAYITRTTAPADADDAASTIRDAIHAVLPGLQLDLLPPSYGAHKTVRFLTPDDREAAMEKQPFALGGGGEVKLVREGETSNVERVSLECVVHAALLDYPKEQRNEGDIGRNCGSFGLLMEVDPACYAAADMSPVRIVVNNKSPSEIPREIRIRYANDRIPPYIVSRHVVPVQILGIWVWDGSQSQYIDANGEKYVAMYNHAP